MSYKLLIINPGSTSTKIGVYEDRKAIIVETLRHEEEVIEQYDAVIDQFEFRKNAVLKVLKEKNFDMTTLSAVVGRGGLLKPIESGTYSVNEKMLDDLKSCVNGQHASNLGAMIANEISKKLNIPSYIVDPVVIDEMDDIARISGMPEISRRSIFHALNQKAVAKRYAEEQGKRYGELNIIVAHMGGGISVGVHMKGKVVDVNNALDGDGPFSPERSGGVPAGDLVKMCFSGKYTEDDMEKKISGKGGFVAYLGTNSAKEVAEAAFSGDAESKRLYDAMGYQVSKEIGACAAVLLGKVDAVILTGGIAYSKTMVDAIKERVEFIAPVVVYPGEDELLALAEGAIRVLDGEEEVKIYE